MSEEFDYIADTDFLDPQVVPTDIKVIGVGGGGNNAVNHMYNQGIEGVSFVVCNTDRQALVHSPVPKKVLLGKTGLGAGNDPEVARKAAEESLEKITELFEDETKMVFITAGMGGGTGTGAAPVVARVAKERGMLTIGIVTIPFLFEGEKKILKALNGADELSKNVDALLVINNERLTEIYPDLDFLNGFAKADDTLSTAARSISELITCNGHINVDFNDVDTTLRNGGTAIISSGFGAGEHRVTKAIEDALNSPLLKNRDILSSKKLLFNLYFSREATEKFSMDEVKELTSFMSQLDNGVDVIWGVAFDDSLENQVKITILAAGFGVTVRDNVNNNRGSLRIEPKKTAAEPDRVSQEYDPTKVEEIRQTNKQKRYIILAQDQLDDDNAIDILERNPTFNRDRKYVEMARASVQANAAPEPEKTEQEKAAATSPAIPNPNAPVDPNRSIDFSID
ncbi:MAG: cell division protein FtsZ [Bacteroidales bacterium]|nr:cell division protein FtsZ [Bacteroidales bacterium]